MNSDNDKEAKILIVDDLKSARKILTKLLESIGYKDITECELAEEALAAIKGDQFDLIISDLNLKDNSGMHLFKEIKALNPYSFIPFILMTSDRTGQDIEPELARELSGFLLKPFNKEDLSFKVDAALNQD